MPENSYNPQSRPANGKSSGNAGCIGCLIPFIIMFIVFMIGPVFTLFDVTGPIPSETREFILSFSVGFIVLLVAVISVIVAVRRKSQEISRNQPGPKPTVPSVKPQPYQIQSNWSRTMQNRPVRIRICSDADPHLPEPFSTAALQQPDGSEQYLFHYVSELRRVRTDSQRHHPEVPDLRQAGHSTC